MSFSITRASSLSLDMIDLDSPERSRPPVARRWHVTPGPPIIPGLILGQCVSLSPQSAESVLSGSVSSRNLTNHFCWTEIEDIKSVKVSTEDVMDLSEYIPFFRENFPNLFARYRSALEKGLKIERLFQSCFEHSFLKLSEKFCSESTELIIADALLDAYATVQLKITPRGSVALIDDYNLLNICRHRLKLLYTVSFLTKVLVPVLKTVLGIGIEKKLLIFLSNALTKSNVFGILCDKTDVDIKFVIDDRSSSFPLDGEPLTVESLRSAIDTTDGTRPTGIELHPLAGNLFALFERAGFPMEFRSKYAVMTLTSICEMKTFGSENLYYASIGPTLDVTFDGKEGMKESMLPMIFPKMSLPEREAYAFFQLCGQFSTKETHKTLQCCDELYLIENGNADPSCWRFSAKYSLIRLESYFRMVIVPSWKESGHIDFHENEVLQLICLSELGVFLENMTAKYHFKHIAADYAYISSIVFEEMMKELGAEDFFREKVFRGAILSTETKVPLHILQILTTNFPFLNQHPHNTLFEIYDFLIHEKKYKEAGYTVFSYIDQMVVSPWIERLKPKWREAKAIEKKLQVVAGVIAQEKEKTRDLKREVSMGKRRDDEHMPGKFSRLVSKQQPSSNRRWVRSPEMIFSQSLENRVSFCPPLVRKDSNLSSRRFTLVRSQSMESAALELERAEYRRLLAKADQGCMDSIRLLLRLETAKKEFIAVLSEWGVTTRFTELFKVYIELLRERREGTIQLEERKISAFLNTLISQDDPWVLQFICAILKSNLNREMVMFLQDEVNRELVSKESDEHLRYCHLFAELMETSTGRTSFKGGEDLHIQTVFACVDLELNRASSEEIKEKCLQKVVEIIKVYPWKESVRIKLTEICRAHFRSYPAYQILNRSILEEGMLLYSSEACRLALQEI